MNSISNGSITNEFNHKWIQSQMNLITNSSITNGFNHKWIQSQMDSITNEFNHNLINPSIAKQSITRCSMMMLMMVTVMLVMMMMDEPRRWDNLHFHHCGAPRHPCLVGHLLLLFIAKWPCRAHVANATSASALLASMPREALLEGIPWLRQSINQSTTRYLSE